jgi:hypothetical protein
MRQSVLSIAILPGVPVTLRQRQHSRGPDTGSAASCCRARRRRSSAHESVMRGLAAAARPAEPNLATAAVDYRSCANDLDSLATAAQKAADAVRRVARDKAILKCAADSGHRER